MRMRGVRPRRVDLGRTGHGICKRGYLCGVSMRYRCVRTSVTDRHRSNGASVSRIGQKGRLSRICQGFVKCLPRLYEIIEQCVIKRAKKGRFVRKMSPPRQLSGVMLLNNRTMSTRELGADADPRADADCGEPIHRAALDKKGTFHEDHASRFHALCQPIGGGAGAEPHAVGSPGARLWPARASPRCYGCTAPLARGARCRCSMPSIPRWTSSWCNRSACAITPR